LLNQYRADIVRISETYGIPPAALATVVYGENVWRSYISELKDEAAILGLIMEGHDASIGICQVKFSTALMLDFGYPPKEFAEGTRTERENMKAALARAAMPYAELYIERLLDPVICMDYAARYLAFLAEAKEYESPELWLSDYNRGLSDYTTPTAYGERYIKVARRYGFEAE